MLCLAFFSPSSSFLSQSSSSSFFPNLMRSTRLIELTKPQTVKDKKANISCLGMQRGSRWGNPSQSLPDMQEPPQWAAHPLSQGCAAPACSATPAPVLLASPLRCHEPMAWMPQVGCTPHPPPRSPRTPGGCVQGVPGCSPPRVTNSFVLGIWLAPYGVPGEASPAGSSPRPSPGPHSGGAVP